MLRTDLGVSPEQLIKYGLKGRATATGIHITDESTLIPALEGWARAHGLEGAAQEQETNTFWGAFSSFQDYLQNIGQTVGGLNPATGTVRPGSMFGDLQNLLINVNSVLSGGMSGGSTSPIGQIMGVGGNLLGGAFTSGGSLLGGFLSGLGQGGADQVAQHVFADIKDFATWLDSSPVQAKLKELGDQFGQFMGQALQLGEKALPDLKHAFEDVGHALADWWNSFTPQQQGSLKNFIAALVEGGAGILEFGSKLIEGVASVQKFSTSLEQWAGNLAANFKQWGANLIQNLIDGIESKIPAVGGIAQNVANQIAQWLHHSKPDVGPLADDDQWMPDMMQLLATTMDRGLPSLQAASMRAAQAIAQPFVSGGAGSNFGAVLSTVNGQTPYQQGQSFVDQFVNGAVSHIQSRGSPLATAMSQLMTEVATEVVNNAVNMINRTSYSATVVPGGYRVYGTMGAATGGW